MLLLLPNLSKKSMCMCMYVCVCVCVCVCVIIVYANMHCMSDGVGWRMTYSWNPSQSNETIRWRMAKFSPHAATDQFLPQLVFL